MTGMAVLRRNVRHEAIERGRKLRAAP